MRILLHAGSHKTGTSTIQNVLDRHRDALRSVGLVYPDARPVFGGSHAAHHPLAHAVADPDDGPLVRRFVAQAEEQARPNDVILLSAEPIYRHTVSEGGGWWDRHAAYLERLATFLASHDVEAVLVFRRRDTFVESLYHERVSKGFEHEFPRYVERVDRLLDYERQVQLFRNAFGTVSELAYEDMAGDDLVQSFLAALDLDVPPLEMPDARARQSVDGRLTLWMASAYRDDQADELVTQRRRFSKSPVSNELFADYGRVTLWADAQARRELLDRYGDTRPIDDDREPAVLTPEIEDRIDDAFDAYLVGKGLEPTNRRARRRAAL